MGLYDPSDHILRSHDVCYFLRATFEELRQAVLDKRFPPAFALTPAPAPALAWASAFI